MRFTWTPREPKGATFEVEEIFEHPSDGYWDKHQMGKWFMQHYYPFNKGNGLLNMFSYEYETDDHDSPI